MLALSLCWLGTGLWVLADGARAKRVAPLQLTVVHGWLLRALGTLVLLACMLPLFGEEGVALGAVAWLLLLATALSFAVLAFPLRPRLYVASLGVAAVTALAAAVLQ
ncbi:MAG TPA: hypothetical protein VJU61_25080 [Polyangiaceae bacterium]|nr:hypothetical protein [Polyangiaceae bacterium]